VNILTIKQTAEKLNISDVTVIRLFDAGILDGFVVHAGKRKRLIRFREASIERFIASREQKRKVAEE
jgi:hypothetical protein